MRALADSIRRVAKVSLLASVLVLAALALAQDSRPAGAVSTEVFFSVSTWSPSPQTRVLLFRNEPGMTQPNVLTLYVWARKIVDPRGLGGFAVDVAYDSSLMSVNDIFEDRSYNADGEDEADDNFLETTGRGDFPLQGGIMCSEPVLEPGHADVSCNTAGAPPEYPYGPQGDGHLATLTVKGGSQLWLVPPYPMLTLTDGTVLLDTGEVIGEEVIDPEVIPSTLTSVEIKVVNCADFDGDGSITLFGDIFAVAYRFAWTDDLELYPDWDPIYDLDENGTISLFGDIFGTAMQFAMECRRPQ